MILTEVKDVLKVTWNDEDILLRGIIERGKNELESLTGTKLDFITNNQVKSLLLDYCRYDYNSSLEYFEENFQSKITRLQIQEGVIDARQEETNEKRK